MSRVAQEADSATGRRRIRLALLVGLLLLLPRLVLAALVLPPQFDLLQLLVVLLLVAGVFVIGAALIRLWLLRSTRLLPVVLAGLVLIVAAGLVLQLNPPDGAVITYDGALLAPLPRVLDLWFFSAVGAVSQLGLVLVVGSIGFAISRWAARRGS